MLKESITYNDFDGNPASELLYFNISKTELADNLHLKDRFENLQKMFSGPQRELSLPEIESVLDLVKTVMRLAYGERSLDGKRFVKTNQVWEEFTQTAAYDAFLFGLFEDPTKAISFLTGVFPQDLMDQAQAQMEADKPSATVELPTAPPVLEKTEETVEGEISDEDLLKIDPRKMTHDQLQRAFALKMGSSSS